jgi:hypothetical protein
MNIYLIIYIFASRIRIYVYYIELKTYFCVANKIAIKNAYGVKSPVRFYITRNAKKMKLFESLHTHTHTSYVYHLA